MRLTTSWAAILWLLTASTAFGAGQIYQTPANVMVELTFHSRQSHDDPFNQVSMDMVVIDPTGRELRVPAFWDGGDLWKSRYASPVLGAHTFRTECAEDTGLNDVVGKIEVIPYHGENPLYKHGPIVVSPNRRYLEHTDGTPFFWLGDTWWMGLCHRLHWPEEFQELTADRKAKGFNVIQIVAGLYPDMFPFDPRGANEAGFPWQTNYTAIRPEYFDAADKRLLYLVDQGFTPCIVGAWGYFMPWMGVDKMKAHWRNLIARYGALPVVWCAAGEANLPWYLAKGFPYDDRNQIHDWTKVLAYIRDTDPWHRPLTLHPTGIGPLTARHSTDDPALIDFDMLQTPHAREDGVPITVTTVRNSYGASPRMPVIDGEASYEMLSDSLPTEWTRRMFWLCLMNGAAGHTYGANGIWQCNRPGQPHGKSPHGGSYGVIPWNESMHLPGSQQVGFGKKFFEQFSWQNFRPHPEWVRWAGGSLAKSAWIWFPEGNPAVDAPAAKRYFRREFALDTARGARDASLRVSADDRFTVYLNGSKVGSGSNWAAPGQFNHLAALLKPGTNVLTIIAENMPAPSANPAGLIAAFDVVFSDHTSTRIVTDAQWSAAQSESGPWSTAMVVAPFGGGPWGFIEGSSNDLLGPQATGIPGAAQVIYVPRPASVRISELGPRAAYRVKYFDPVSGVTSSLGEVRSDEHGNWECAPPAGMDHDWVVTLELIKERVSSAGTRAVLATKDLAWDLDWSDGRLRSVWFDNKLTRHRFELSEDKLLELTFSSAPDRVAEPFLLVNDFQVQEARLMGKGAAEFELHSKSLPVNVILHFDVNGAVREKWFRLTNQSGRKLLLLDAALDDFATAGTSTGGGNGKPLFLEDEVHAAIWHPIGVNTATGGRVQLTYSPGKKLEPDEIYTSPTSLIGVAREGKANDDFVSLLDARASRPRKLRSIYTPFGINNQWGACPALDEEESLDVLDLLQKFQGQGVRFDYFTFDTGWVDPASDLTRFRPGCFPNGPGDILNHVDRMGMNFGLWFGTSWATQSCWDYAPAYGTGRPPGLPWREGSPLTEGGINFCFASEPYFSIFKNAVLYHIRENKVRFLKFDGGNYYCDSPDHGHLPGKYSVAAMYNNLIDVARSARAAAPDTFILWYWGVGSPFWALYGDMVFESGLEMEGSGTSSFPTLYYRDSVTLAQDQNAQFAATIPPRLKDSLGVWLSDSRWGNFMGKERWREAMVMDLGRGSLLYPNLWGDLYQLNEQDIAFLSRMNALAKENESLLLHRRKILGDPMLNEPYGYAYGDGGHALLFLDNANFTSRHVQLPLDADLGLSSARGTNLFVTSDFPERTRVQRPDGAGFKFGDTLDLWLRPFEVLLLDVSTHSRGKVKTVRRITDEDAADLGMALSLRAAKADSLLDARFADAPAFAAKGFRKRDQSYEAVLPHLGNRPSILAISIKLRRGDAEWKYAPTVEQIVQPILRIDGENVQMVPVPDGRQCGNTQSFGCSWVVYKFRLPQRWSGQPLQLAIHAWLPDGVEARPEAWVDQQWWQDETRPVADGYYTDAPQ
jgi:hypothetical protein